MVWFSNRITRLLQLQLVRYRIRIMQLWAENKSLGWLWLGLRLRIEALMLTFILQIGVGGVMAGLQDNSGRGYS